MVIIIIMNSRYVRTFGAPRRLGGFTLVEMVLVMAIIAVLVGMGIYSLVGVVEGAEEGRVDTDLQALETTLIRYKTKAGTYPSESQGLQALVTKPDGEPVPRRWAPFIKEEGLLDPWRNRYAYRKPGEENPNSYDLYSLGPDGKDGTGDEIGNW